MSKSLVCASFAMAALLAVAGCAYNAGPTKTGSTAMGPALVDARGMTLYTYDKDAEGRSVCAGKCAANWPPLVADAGAVAPAGYTVITRDDGSKQWAYSGKPLYTWVKDQKPGDTTGEGFGKVWHIARP